MNRILVTGSMGQLGSELAVLAAEIKDFEFLFTDYDTLDVTDTSAVEIYMEKNHPDFVINCAAFTAVDQAEEETESCRRLNALAPGIIAECCRKISARLIHISTDYVYDGRASYPYTEDCPVNPLGVYGSTKREGEIACLAFTDPVIIRTSWLYSSFGKNFVKTMIRLGREKEELKVVFDQIGTPTYARDLAVTIFTIIRAASLNQAMWKPGIYHYSNEGVCSWYDFAVAVHRFAGIRCNVIPVLSKDFVTLAQRPNYSVLNKAKIKTCFNIQIPHWMESLDACMKILNST